MKVAFLGDIALIGKYDVYNNANGKVKILKDICSSCDYVIANLETPFTDLNTTSVCKSMHLKSNPRNVDVLKYIGVDAVCLANNHIFDYGKKGVIHTVRVLEDNKIEWFGVNGKQLNIDVSGQKLGIGGYCCYSTNATCYSDEMIKGVHSLTRKNIYRQIKENKSQARFPILSFHWGYEHTNYPAHEHINLARKLMNEELIIYGHHPHIIQGIEEKSNALTAYSLGNCMFDDCKSIDGKLVIEQKDYNKISFVLIVEIIDNKIIKYETVGIIDTENGIEKTDIGDMLKKISNEIAGDFDVEKYELCRMKQYKENLQNKLGKKNFKWLCSKLNRNSIGARIDRVFNEQKYKKEFSDLI